MRIRFTFLSLVLLLICPLSRAADVEQLLSAMTLDEKLAMLHGTGDPEPAVGLSSAGYVPPLPRLGIPPLRLADGPAGIRTTAPATALPAPVALAASFDRELAYRYGETIGMEGLARNQDVLLSPMVNIVRVPQAGRNFETFGEDPLLASGIVTNEILGIQSKGMMATVKHFAVNNQETDRLHINASVDERTLREIYLPAFEAAVKNGVAGVMCAYNRVNGAYACENGSLLQDILRDEWGFDGFVMTDWWANHSLAALRNGLNLEMPGFTHSEYEVAIEFDKPLRAAVKEGSINEADVDAALRPMLVMMNRFGLLDGKRPPVVSRDADNSAVALETAIKGAVLLKNDNAALPLQDDDLDNVLVMGPTANWTLIGGGGSSRVLPFKRDSAVEALRAMSGQANISYTPGFDADGVVIPATALRMPDGTTHGIEKMAPDGSTETVDVINHIGPAALQHAGMWYWHGELIAPENGTYQLILQTDGPVARLFLDDDIVISNDGGVLSDASLVPTSDGLRNASVTLNLQAGQHYKMRVETWRGDTNPLQLRLGWVTPSQRESTIKATVDAAKTASSVVIFAHVEGTEGSDRNSLALPGYQDRVIEEVAKAAQGKTIVVLNTGAPITMPWVNEVDAILQMWYPGQAGGEATAALLLGRENPSGKLPVTFPVRETDVPTTDVTRYPGIDHEQNYAEGLFVGYRWYDAENIAPLFPFGHGLSYTSFSYSNLRVHPEGDNVRVSFTLTNSGARGGSEVPQVYLSHIGVTEVQTEKQKLVAFDKVSLSPGESRDISVTLAARRFAWWNEANHGWQTLPGEKHIAVGASSRDLRLGKNFTYTPDTATLLP
jgi:beta-glucosidase